METVEVTILEPKAKSMLVEMKNDKLIEFTNGESNSDERKPLKFGCMKGLVLYIADDFDAPLEDFKDYM